MVFCKLDVAKNLNKEKTFENIWSVHKKAVPLQPFSRLLQVSREIERKCRKNVTLKISHLQRKCKKVAKKFGQSKKKQYLCSRFRAKRKRRRKITVIFERLKQ